MLKHLILLLQRHRAAALIVVLLATGAVFTAAALLSKPHAPDVTLVNLDGERVRLADLRGQVVLVNFWATTCVVCVKEMPRMADTYRRFAGRGFRAFAVAMPYDRPDWVLNYRERNPLPFPIVLDVQDEIARAFDDTRVTPTTFLIDTQGRIVKRYIGEPDFAELQQRIEGLLAG
jgi:peroxiredoxin